MVTTNVLNIFFRKLAFETILKTLPILNVLISVVEAPKEELVKNVRKTLVTVPITISKSKIFHPLVK